ncbi:hypothetical protein ACFO9E_27340 [Streptomyces maoxianensis]|uniref:Uncharacterized protein n=1 Tax=Streptomyces maoxianensis TaxID=1459942 RepID=A0ABV9GAZ7_9ACTN
MRQADKVEHKLGDILFVEVGQNDYRAPRVTPEHGHEFRRGTCHDAELFGKRPHRAPQAPSRGGSNGVDCALGRSSVLAAVVHEPREQPRFPAPF